MLRGRELGRFLLPLARVVGSPRARVKNLAFQGTGTCKRSPLLREPGRMPALGYQLQVHCSAHVGLSRLQRVPYAWGLVRATKVEVTSALRMGLPWAQQPPKMLASHCISLPWLMFSLLVVETWLQPSRFVTAVQSSFEAAKGGFPGGSVIKNLPANAGDTREAPSDPWVGKIAWSRKWQPTPVILRGKFHGQRSLAATVHTIAKSQTRLSTHTVPRGGQCAWAQVWE